MMRYSVQPSARIFVKGYGFLYSNKNMCKKIDKNLSSKYSQNLIDHAKKSAIDALKTASKRAVQETAEATGDFNGNKIADRIMKVSKSSPHNSLETIKNEHDKEIPKEGYISPEERQKIIEDLR